MILEFLIMPILQISIMLLRLFAMWNLSHYVGFIFLSSHDLTSARYDIA